jgi:hypothetical protein
MHRITVDQYTYQRLAAYAEATGQEVSAVANEALNDWMDITGDSILEALAERRFARFPAGKVLPFSGHSRIKHTQN